MSGLMQSHPGTLSSPRQPAYTLLGQGWRWAGQLLEHRAFHAVGSTSTRVCFVLCNGSREQAWRLLWVEFEQLKRNSNLQVKREKKKKKGNLAAFVNKVCGRMYIVCMQILYTNLYKRLEHLQIWVSLGKERFLNQCPKG